MAMLPQQGLAAGAAGWKAGHEAVRSGGLLLDGLDGPARDALVASFAADRARTYMREMVAEHALTEAQGARLFMVYMHAFGRGALDQALDGGALWHRG